MSSSKHRVALVTGAGTGVGRATAIRLAKHGYDVVVNYSRSESDARETADIIQQSGRKALLCQADVSQDVQVVQMLRDVEQHFGRLDALVNNAAITHFVPHHKLDDMTEQKWDQILAVNLKGPFFVTRASAPLLRQSDAGSVVNVSSVAGLSGLGSSIAYCASKGALNTMTKSLARVLAPKVRVNAVCPGPIVSRWLLGVMPEEDIVKMTDTYPIPRPAQPDDIADAVLFFILGTSLATGQCLVVDGGRTM